MMHVSNFTKEDLAAALAACDDSAGDHIIWMSKAGHIEIDLLDEGEYPAQWAAEYDDVMLFRLETLHCGNGYTGARAAKARAWVTRLYNALQRNYQKPTLRYVEYF